jgi:L-asparaginase II
MTNIHKSGLLDAPVLAEIFRGYDQQGQAIIECVHRGLIVVMHGNGQVLYEAGDIDTIVHMRSVGKPFQVLPLFDAGFFDPQRPAFKPNLTQKDVALLMSSHSGQAIHTSRVQELLDYVGLEQSVLRCGIHPPQDEVTRKNLQKSGQTFSVLHNNCSGKHVAMLMACLERGFDIASYEQPDHPLQQWIKRLIATVSDLDEHSICFGIDGCSLPSWAISLRSTALMYARLVYWQNHLPATKPAFLKHAFSTMLTSAMQYPEYLAGSDRFDTELMRAGNNQIFSKTGADGMQALAIMPSKKYPHGLGIAIKIADGDSKQSIRPLLVGALLSKLDIWPKHANLDRFMPSVTNFRGIVTGGALYHLK